MDLVQQVSKINDSWWDNSCGGIDMPVTQPIIIGTKGTIAIFVGIAGLIYGAYKLGRWDRKSLVK